MAAALLLFSCNAADGIEPKPDLKENVLSINVSEARLEDQTRASHDGFSTTFANGDAIGVYAVSGNKKVMLANMKVTRTAGVWTPEEDIEYSSDYSYYAYFPWKASPTNGPAVDDILDANDVDTGFHDMIDSWTIVSDQSTEANYQLSDMMMGKAVVTNKNLSFPLYHKMGLFYWKNKGYTSGGVKHTDNTVTISEPTYKPFEKSSKMYYIGKPGTTYSFKAFSAKAPASGCYISYGVFVAYNL